MTDRIESEGPDKHRNSIKCRQFHDMQGTDLGGSYNACCCNPCETLRPGVPSVVDHKEWEWCCRCVPRALYLRFIPDDQQDYGYEDCCRPGAVPMFHNRFAGTGPHKPGDPLYSVYQGGLYGIYVDVKLGNVTTVGDYYGYEQTEGRECAWLITVRRGATILKEELLPIDHYGTTCIDVPSMLLVSGIEGPEHCIGSIYLDEAPKARLPFLLRQEVKEFNDMRDPRDIPGCEADEYGERSPQCDPMFINFCGECEEDLDDMTCVSVAGVLYVVDRLVNGKPSFINAERLVHWNGSQWTLSHYVYYPEELEELADGPKTPDCPIGMYSWNDGYGYVHDGDDCFCVSPCDDADRDLCGCCGQVCSRICAYGQRHLDDDIIPVPYVEFRWFEDWVDGAVTRGWYWTNPSTEVTEYIYLENVGMLAILVDGERWERDYFAHSFGDPDFPYWRGELDGVESYVYWSAPGACWAIMKGGNEIALGPTDPDDPLGAYGAYTVAPDYDYYDRRCRIRLKFETTEQELYYSPNSKIINLETGCSCGLDEIFTNNDDPDEPRYLRLRCGFCTPWEYHCGHCRCVPAELCVNYYDGETLHGNMILSWNESIKGWGDDSDPIRLLLQRNLAGQCVVYPDVSGWEPPTPEGSLEPTLPVWDCGIESVTRLFDPDSSEILSVFYEDYSVPGRPVYLLATSLTPDCDVGNCTEATECYQNCGSHPQTLYMTITQWTEIGDSSLEEEVPPVSITITLQFWQTLDYITIGPDGPYIRYSCGYLGFIPANNNAAGGCCLIKIDYRSQLIQGFTPIAAQGGCSHITSFVYTVTESCDPYYADTGILLSEQPIYWECMGTTGPTHRVRIIITE